MLKCVTNHPIEHNGVQSIIAEYI